MSGKNRNHEYFKSYYLKNRDKICEQRKARYLKNRENPEKLLVHRQKMTEITKRYRARHPEKIKEIRKKVYLKRKYNALLKVSKTGKVECGNCGCDEISFLEINHINGGGCKEFRNTGWSMNDSVLSGKRATEDLEIRCRLCNALHYLAGKNITQSKRFNVKWN